MVKTLSLAAIIGLTAASAQAAITTNAITTNAITTNAITTNAITTNAISSKALSLSGVEAANGTRLGQLNGVSVEAIALPGEPGQ